MSRPYPKLIEKVKEITLAEKKIAEVRLGEKLKVIEVVLKGRNYSPGLSFILVTPEIVSLQ